MHFPALNDLIEALHSKGGEVFFTGGVVRDHILHLPESKDIDLEVFNMDEEILMEVLTNAADGGKVNKQHNFPVWKLRYNGVDLDVALPRRENKTGPNHSHFMIETDNVSLEEAQRRRDFTCNAIYVNATTGKYVDYFNGISDLVHNRLHPVSTVTFVEDPLRVFRAAQMIVRFGFEPTDALIKVCQSMSDQRLTLGPNEIWGEFQKIITKRTPLSITTGRFWTFIHLVWVDMFPELMALGFVPQDETHHPEGGVWNHTVLTVDAALELLWADERLYLAALCHDFGKRSTTVWNEEKGKYTSYGHDHAGEADTRIFLNRLGAPEWMHASIIGLQREHMSYLGYRTLNTDFERKRFVRRLSNRLKSYQTSLTELQFVMQADKLGRGVRQGLDMCQQEMFALGRIMGVDQEPPKPLVTGRDLIGLGLTPGPKFKALLNKLYNAQLDGLFTSTESGREYLLMILPEDYADAKHP